MPDLTVVLLVSSGAAWESGALTALTEDPRTVLLKRCVDVPDLLAAAATGQADVAVVATDLPDLDAAVVDDLLRHGVRTIGVAAGPGLTRPHADRLRLAGLLAADRMAELAALVVASPVDPTLPAPGYDDPRLPPPPPPSGHGIDPGGGVGTGQGSGRVLAVWGPGGGPGRSTVASGLAGELARRGLTTVLVDADPYGGAIAQQLGILDEASGLLSAARLVGSGALAERWPAVQRRLSDHLRVLTGLPRPDRWSELRPGTLAAIVEQACRDAQVVLDTGFSLEPDAGDPAGRPERNGLTREALEAADDIVLVGSADPVGLARLARALSEVHELLPDPHLRVVVNRMRATLGWREADVAAMLSGFGAPAGVHFLPDDQPAVDRAMVAGRLLVESGESPLTRALAGLVDAMAGTRV